MPADTPVTIPPATVPCALLAPQTPLPVASVSVTVCPVHTVVLAGEIAAGEATTVTGAVAEHPERVYFTVSSPTITPVTTPATLVALALVIVHVPPEVPSVNVTALPIQIVADAGEIAATAAFTVTGYDAESVPQV